MWQWLLEAGTSAAGFPVAGKGATWEAAAGTMVCCCCSCSSSGTRTAEFLGAEKGQHGRQVLMLGCVAVAVAIAVQVVPGQQNS